MIGGRVSDCAGTAVPRSPPKQLGALVLGQRRHQMGIGYACVGHRGLALCDRSSLKALARPASHQSRLNFTIISSSRKTVKIVLGHSPWLWPRGVVSPSGDTDVRSKFCNGNRVRLCTFPRPVTGNPRQRRAHTYAIRKRRITPSATAKPIWVKRTNTPRAPLALRSRFLRVPDHVAVEPCAHCRPAEPSYPTICRRANSANGPAPLMSSS